MAYVDDARFGGTGGIIADLAAGSIVDGFGDTDTVTGIERVVGTDQADTISGDSSANTLDGRGGDDVLHGLAGDDELIGGDGNDTLDGGAGRDILNGGNGDDILDGSGGDALSQSYGDIVLPGTGNNTIIGHAGAFGSPDGGGIDLLYENLSGTGGLTITMGLNGTGTTVSGIAGMVNDTFTYVDHVEGSQDADTFNGSADAFQGWVGEAGNDIINGGGGVDELAYRWENGSNGVTVNLAAGTATDSYGDTDTLSGIENVWGTLQDDVIAGDSGDNNLRGDDGNDILDGGAGSDDLHGGTGNDTLYGGDGNDNLDGGDGNDTIYGGAGEDAFVSSQGDDFFDGGSLTLGENAIIYYDDPAGVTVTFDNTGTGSGTAIDGWGDTDTFQSVTRVHGSGFDDVIDASADSVNHFFVGHDGSDQILGGSGYDKLSWWWENGSSGAVVDVAAGTDTDTFGNIDSFSGIEDFQGSNFADTFNGAGSDDVFEGMGGADTFNGAGGVDTVDYSLEEYYGGTNGINVDLAGGTGTDTFGATDIYTSIENIYGSSFDDTIQGNADQNFLDGSQGNDLLIGGGGDDQLYGGEGDDIMIGGAGNDHLDGLTGTDIYVFASGSGSDDISNFDYTTEGDQIDVSAFGFASVGDFASMIFDGTNTIIQFTASEQVEVSNYDITSLADPNDAFIFA